MSCNDLQYLLLKFFLCMHEYIYCTYHSEYLLWFTFLFFFFFIFWIERRYQQAGGGKNCAWSRPTWKISRLLSVCTYVCVLCVCTVGIHRKRMISFTQADVYICMYVYEWIYIYEYSLYVCKYVCMCICRYVCMYVCMYMYVCLM